MYIAVRIRICPLTPSRLLVARFVSIKTFFLTSSPIGSNVAKEDIS